MARWRPTKVQRRAYAEKMREAEEKYNFIGTIYPIREGCRVRFVGKSDNVEYSGVVAKSSYGVKTGQHTFTIDLDGGGYKIVKGRNLYDRLLEHIPGDIAIDPDHPLNNRK